MKEKFFTIGEISKIKGITVKALRFYEKTGLLMPVYKDPSSKYRYYSMEQFIQLDIIIAARSMGISLKDIKVILDKKDNNTLLEFMDYQRRNAAQKIAELEKTVSMINLVQNNIHNSISSVSNPGIFFNEIPARYIIARELRETSEEGIMMEYSNLYKHIDENMFINTYETGIIFTPDEKMEFYPSRVFNVVTVEEKSNISLLSTIPEGRFLCICYDKHNAQDQLSKFNAYLKQKNLQPSLILQVDLLNNIFDFDNQCVQLQALI